MSSKLRAECAGNRGADSPDATASRTGSRYVWARVTDRETGARFELTLWRDGRWSLEARSSDAAPMRDVLRGKVGADD